MTRLEELQALRRQMAHFIETRSASVLALHGDTYRENMLELDQEIDFLLEQRATVGELVNVAYMEAVELDLSEYVDIPLDEMTDQEQKNWFASVPMIDPETGKAHAADE